MSVWPWSSTETTRQRSGPTSPGFGTSRPPCGPCGGGWARPRRMGEGICVRQWRTVCTPPWDWTGDSRPPRLPSWWRTPLPMAWATDSMLSKKVGLHFQKKWNSLLPERYERTMVVCSLSFSRYPNTTFFEISRTTQKDLRMTFTCQNHPLGFVQSLPEDKDYFLFIFTLR